jgi:UDP-GlcNAc:undecaprenyl-phosphate GlcNAc-1-phosphate transferase
MNGFTVPAIAFIATIVLIVLLRPMALRYGLTDSPGERKLHSGEMPLIGGIAIYFGMGIAVLVANWLGDVYIVGMPFVAFFGGATLLLIVGAWDDWVGLSPAIRFVAQIIAGLVMVYGGGIVLDDLGSLWPGVESVKPGLLAVPFTVFVTVGMINAINMCDGLDGLSGNMTLVLLCGLGLANSFWGGLGHLQMLNVVSAAVAGFLVFNQRSFWRNKAWIFLGDAGSMMLGFALAWNAVEVTQGADRVISPPTVLWFLSIPVFDTVTMMVRRIRRGQSPFQADSEHLHHLLVRTGFSVGETIGIICLLAASGCVIGLLCAFLRIPDWIIAISFLLTGFFYLGLMESAWRTRRFMGREVQAI